MNYIFRYLNLLQIEFAEMTQQLDGELAGFLAVLTIAMGWFWLRGNVIKR